MNKDKDFKIQPNHFLEVLSTRDIAILPQEEQTNQKLLGVTDEVLDKYYQTAYTFIDEQKWPEASSAFTFLTFLNPFVHNFWICLGIAEQCQAKFQEALVAYTMAEATDPNDPTPIANSFQCAMALGEQEFATYCLNKALVCCGDKQEHAELKAKLMKLKNTQ